MSYCQYIKDLSPENVHKIYHDTQYGFPISDDNELFGRLILEINQAGLSWDIILKKQDNFRNAFSNYDIKKVAKYDDNDVSRLLGDKGIIRNRLKINAAIHNANQLLKIQKEHGTFNNWLEKQGQKSLKEWMTIFKKEFKFTGEQIVNEFLMSIGILPGAHSEDCPIGILLKKK